MRRNLNGLLNQEASVAGYSPADNAKWAVPGEAPLGALMRFKIPVLGPFGEQAVVVTSTSEQARWIFTPVRIAPICPREHPVSGNREFGWKATGATFEFHTRGVDRSTTHCFGVGGEDTTYSGTDKFWRNWQAKLVAHVAKKGGKAAAAAPVIHRPTWAEVKASGLFARDC